MTLLRLLAATFCLLAFTPATYSGERLRRIEVDNVAAYYDLATHSYIEEATGEKCAISLDDTGRVNITRTERAIQLAPYGLILPQHIKPKIDPEPVQKVDPFSHHPHLVAAPQLLASTKDTAVDNVPEPPAVAEVQPDKPMTIAEARAKRNILPGILVSTTPEATPSPTASPTTPTAAKQMLVLNNNLRTRAGLRPQDLNEQLNAAAQDHANYMARTGQFSHYVNGGPSGRASKYGFTSGVRENIATGGDINNAFRMWTNSGAHYASIVSNTSSAGFGYAHGANGGTYYVGVYGTPQGEATPSTATSQPRTDIAPNQNNSFRRGLFGRFR